MILGMNKKQAIEFFGNMSHIARALDIKPQAVQQWPEILPRSVSDRVELAMLKLKAKRDAQINI